MRATLRSLATIVTIAQTAAVSMMSKWCGLTTASEVFLIFTKQNASSSNAL